MTADFVIELHGSVNVLYPENDSARDWIDEHIVGETTFWGSGLIVESRYLDDIVHGLLDEGFVLQCGRKAA